MDTHNTTRYGVQLIIWGQQAARTLYTLLLYSKCWRVIARIALAASLFTMSFVVCFDFFVEEAFFFFLLSSSSSLKFINCYCFVFCCCLLLLLFFFFFYLLIIIEIYFYYCIIIILFIIIFFCPSFHTC